MRRRDEQHSINCAKAAKAFADAFKRSDGEVVAAVRAIGRTLESAGADWHDLTQAITSPSIVAALPDTWRGIAIYCHDRNRCLTPREATFVSDMCSHLVCAGTPTEKQAAWLRAIYAKVRSEYVS